jgi:hypothetical protein
MRASVRRGAYWIPVAIMLFGMALSGAAVGTAFFDSDAAVAADNEMDCTSIRESRRKLRLCLDARDAQRLSTTRMALASVDSYPTPVERDLLRMTLMARSPRLAETICASVETDEAQRLCGRFERRPHLYAVEEGWVLREEAQSSRRERSGSDTPASGSE